MYLMHRLPYLMTDSAPYHQVLREGEVIYVDGKPVKRNPTRFLARGLLVPVDGQELLLQPEGDRLKEQYWIFQDPTQSRMEDGSTQRLSMRTEDKVKLFGNTYIIQNTRVWGSYTQVRCTRVDIGADSVAWPELPQELT